MEYRNQDITTVNKGLVIHGVNCQAVMGSGVARAIKEKWPIIYKEYMAQGSGDDLLGTSHIIHISDNLYVGNCYTQVFFGPGDKAYASLEAIEEALDSSFLWASTLGLTIHSPKIGCGLGGLKWERVSKIFQQLIDKHDYDNVIIYEI